MSAEGERTAVVFSGGGAKGAYAVGVLRAILSGVVPNVDAEPFPDIYSGTSVGAFNAILMAAYSERSPRFALDRLERVWRRRIASGGGRCGNGVFRLRGLPLEDLDPACLARPWRSLAEMAGDSVHLAREGLNRAVRFAASQQPLTGRVLEAVDIEAFFDRRPLERLLRDTCDLAALGRSRLRLNVMTSRWDTGRERVFDRHDIADRYGHAPILASMAIPAIFPPVTIEGAPYVDGGLSSNTPLRPAIRDGARVLHVIYLDPLLEESRFPRDANTLDVLARTFAILGAQHLNSDIGLARSVNQGLDLLRPGRISGRLAGDATRLLAAAGTIGESLRRTGGARERRHLVIHRYRPSGDLGSGADLLNFSLRQIDRLIQRGYDDTIRHDCEESGCVLADGSGAIDGAASSSTSDLEGARHEPQGAVR